MQFWSIWSAKSTYYGFLKRMLWTLHSPISEGIEKVEHKLRDFLIGITTDCPKIV